MKQVLLMEKDINPSELDFLLRYPAVPGLVSPVDFLSNLSWGGIKVSPRTRHSVHVVKHSLSSTAQVGRFFSYIVQLFPSNSALVGWLCTILSCNQPTTVWPSYFVLSSVIPKPAIGSFRKDCHSFNIVCPDSCSFFCIASWSRL